MASLPTYVFDLVLPLAPDRLSSCTVTVGKRVEVDLQMASELLSSEELSQVTQYWESCAEFWSRLRSGDLSGSYVTIERELLTAKQQDKRSKASTGPEGRTDLGVEVDSLSEITSTTWVAPAILGQEVDFSILDKDGAIYGAKWAGEEAGERKGKDGAVRRGGAGGTLTFTVSDNVYWPAALGGASSEGEIARTFILTARHAAWRDRAKRRLAGISVVAREVWPAPASVPATI